MTPAVMTSCSLVKFSYITHIHSDIFQTGLGTNTVLHLCKCRIIFAIFIQIISFFKDVSQCYIDKYPKGHLIEGIK